MPGWAWAWGDGLSNEVVELLALLNSGSFEKLAFVGINSGSRFLSDLSKMGNTLGGVENCEFTELLSSKRVHKSDADEDAIRVLRSSESFRLLLIGGCTFPVSLVECSVSF